MFNEVTCTIPGAKRKEQVEENLAAIDLPPLSKEAMTAVQTVYDRYIHDTVHHYW